MIIMMQYKGFYARVECSDEETMSGYVVGFRDSMPLRGDTVDEVKKSFHDTIDSYTKTFKDKK